MGSPPAGASRRPRGIARRPDAGAPGGREEPAPAPAPVGEALRPLPPARGRGGGCAAWLVHHEQRQGAGWTRVAFASIEAHPGVDDARWLQEQLSAEPGEPGESILWEEPDSF
ncbi:protein of unknown function [Methylacidimicrobium sp. AP8]|nr:protein of unknown function [Methylacidimicrobium sp. AP8]